MVKPLMVNAFNPANAERLDAPLRALLARRQRVLGPSYKLFYEEPVHLVRAEGVYMYDADGNRYLDVYNNVPSVGHCHPRVVAAMTKQAATLNTHTRYLHETILDYAEKLVATFPPELSNVMFTCTGSETAHMAAPCTRNTRRTASAKPPSPSIRAYLGSSLGSRSRRLPMCQASRRPHAATITRSSQRTGSSPSAALTRATSTKPSPHATSTTATRPMRRAAWPSPAPSGRCAASSP